MARYEQRIKARLMRRGGISIVTIARDLKVTKGSVSLWCRDIVLNQEQIKKLQKQKGSILGRWVGAEANRQKKKDAINESNNWANINIGRISKRELLLVATALYWCEGSKSDSTSSFMLVNSDPKMILVMKKFLIEVMGVPIQDIVCSIQINIVHKDRIKKVLIFWKKLLQLKNSQIRKPYFVYTKVSKIYENYDSYFGTCRLFVRRSKVLKYKILGAIEAFKKEILST